VAYAIPKRVGGAVERNRLRRRLRAVIAELARDPEGPVPKGALVVSASPDAARRDVEDLRMDVERLLSLLAQRAATGGSR
jgi:ribonuclease P protein component